MNNVHSKRVWRGVALGALLALLVSCNGGEEGAETPALPAPEGPQGIVQDLVNDVDAHALPEGEWEDAQANQVIYTGGEVWALEASTARVRVETALVRVAPNTIFTLEQPDADTLQLSLDDGQVWINVEGLDPGETFQVETPAAVASVRGTRFSVLVDAGITVVSTQVDTVTVSSAAGTVDVGPGKQTVVPPGGAPGAVEYVAPEVDLTWGMAVGYHLDPLLPVVEETTNFTYTGYAQSWGCSTDGSTFFVETYDPTVEDDPSLGISSDGYVFYDLYADSPVTVTLPFDTEGVGFNPAGDGLAYLDFGNDRICLAENDTSNPSCFTATVSYSDLTWSPDGEWLLYYGYAPNTTDGLNIYKVRADGSEATQLTFADEGRNRSAAWSPDSSQIAYLDFADYQSPAELWVMDADGTNGQMLFTNTSWYDAPTWYPDGSSLVVLGYEDPLMTEMGQGNGVYVVPLDGSDPTMIPGTDGMVASRTPVWAPTGDGWPLYISGFDYDDKRSGIWAYVPDDGQDPAHVNGASRGPAWCLNDTTEAGFGFNMGTSEAPWGGVYIYRVEEDFWE